MRIILDCDPGIDDTYALIHLAARHHTGELELEAVTTTAGNVGAVQCARNAAWVLSLCGLHTIPIAAGCPEPVALELTTTPETHGDFGLGYAEAPQRHIDTDWQELWLDAISRGTDDLHLIITGPATNAAVFAETHPEHFAALRHITVMGGAFNYPGNTTPSAEWNFWVDPHAAAAMFAQAPTEITVCPLNVTERMLLEPDALERHVEALGDAEIARHLPDITRFYFEFHQDVGVGYRAQLHDLLTVIVALGGTGAFRLSTVDIEPSSPLTRGTSLADDGSFWDRDPNARILTDADIDAAWSSFTESCGILARAAAGDAAIERSRHLRADD